MNNEDVVFLVEFIKVARVRQDIKKILCNFSESYVEYWKQS